MSQHDDYLRTDTRSFRLSADIGLLMLKGAGYAAAFCFAIYVIAWVMIGVSGLLPEQSKEAADPTPLSFLMVLPEVDTKA